MKQGKLLIILAGFALVSTLFCATLRAETTTIIPINKVSPTEPQQNISFLKTFNVITLALSVYQMDAKKRMSKEEIQEKISDELASLRSSLDIIFDINKIDLNRRGFTRYYPFGVNGEDLIIRIFNISEKHFLPECDVLYEGRLDNLALGFQITPGIRTILSSEKPGRIEIPDTRLLATQP